MTMRRRPSFLLCLTALAGLTLTACGASRDAPVFNGVKFRSDVRASKEDRASFVATVRNATPALEGAVLAAEYEGVRYCITYIGNSDIQWQVGPDTPPAQLVASDGTLSLRGRCAG
ncbi:hypothetical protein ACFSDD_11750 [Salipiger marinus]|uniref:hypothetical protein n=1 Tax=Salipiger marinus TaxID=555512 RepID=UPI001E52DE1B|nr:hypothetical protein [Salipiger manganoxidans]MCD1616850.1 hypothetical protein [Salipiger manganoxidans]MEB3420043.1 hypothetical protein [Salipiger manganoxidans]